MWLFWLPDFLVRRHHLDLKTFGPPLVAVYVVSDLGSIAGGWMSSRLLQRGFSLNAARKYTMLLCAVLVLPVFGAASCRQPVGSGRHRGPRGRGAPGLFLQPLHPAVRRLPAPSGRLPRRHRRHRRRDRRHAARQVRGLGARPSRQLQATFSPSLAAPTYWRSSSSTCCRRVWRRHASSEATAPWARGSRGPRRGSPQVHDMQRNGDGGAQERGHARKRGTGHPVQHAYVTSQSAGLPIHGPDRRLQLLFGGANHRFQLPFGNEEVFPDDDSLPG